MKSNILTLTFTCLMFAVPVQAVAADSLLLVGNKGENTVSFIDLETGEELSRKPVSANAPHEIAASPDGRHAAVVNYGDNDIDIFDIASREIVHSYDLGNNTRPHGIIWHQDGRILATTEGGKSIIILDNAEEFAERRLSSIRTGENGTHMLVVSPDGQQAYTANMGSGSVSQIDLTENKTVKSVAAGNQPEGIDLTPDGRELWVSARGNNTVYVLDAHTLETEAEIAVGAFPLRLAISPDGRKAVTSNYVDGSLTVIDIPSRKVERTITVSGSAEAAQVTVIFSPDGQKLYVAETGANRIAVIDFESGKVLNRIKAGRQGDGLAIID